MTLKAWLIKELTVIVEKLNSNTALIDATFAKHKSRIDDVEDRLKYIERLLMEKAR